MPDVVREVHNAGRRVNPGEFAKVFQVRIHLFITDDGLGEIPRKRRTLVLVKDGLRMLVQFNPDAVNGLFGDEHDHPIPDVVTGQLLCV